MTTIGNKFAQLGTSIINLVGTRASKNMDNLTSTGEANIVEIVENAGISGGSSRNIGEIIASTVPLTDAGLHLLDGALISGSGVYTDFVNYIKTTKSANPNAECWAKSTTTTTYNYENYNGVIENNGILSGFSTTKRTYARIPIPNPTTSFEVVLKVYRNSSTTYSTFMYTSQATYGMMLRVVDATGNISFWFGTNGSNWWNAGTGLVLPVDTWMYVKATWNSNNVLNFYSSTDGETWTEGTPYTATTVVPNFMGCFNLGGTMWENYPWNGGQFDLNGCYCKVDGETVWQGKTVTTRTAQQEWEYQISKYGTCNKFVVNTDSVRLPLTSTTEKYLIYTYGDQSTDSWCRVYSDGWCEQGGSYTTYNGAVGYATVIFHLPYTSTNYLVLHNEQVGADAIENANDSYRRTVFNKCPQSFQIYMDYLISNKWYTCGYTDISKFPNTRQYEYVVVANQTKTAIQVDIDEIAADLNNKVDKSDLQEVQCVVETYKNGGSWYRLYSDGWCEQGGYNDTSVAGQYSVTFFKPYIDLTYTITMSAKCYPSGTTGDGGTISSRSRTGFTYYDAYTYGSTTAKSVTGTVYGDGYSLGFVAKKDGTLYGLQTAGDSVANFGTTKGHISLTSEQGDGGTVLRSRVVGLTTTASKSGIVCAITVPSLAVNTSVSIPQQTLSGLSVVSKKLGTLIIKY